MFGCAKINIDNENVTVVGDEYSSNRKIYRGISHTVIIKGLTYDSEKETSTDSNYRCVIQLLGTRKSICVKTTSWKIVGETTEDSERYAVFTFSSDQTESLPEGLVCMSIVDNDNSMIYHINKYAIVKYTKLN